MNFKINKNAFSLIEISIVILIIGILVGGIIGGRFLVNKSRISSARALTQSSPVTAVKDLSLWLETTSEKSFIASEINSSAATKPISTWFDLNPFTQNKFDATQGTSPNRPIYVENAINGLPALNFNGTDQYFSTNLDLRIATRPDITGFAVFRGDDSTQIARIIYSDAGWGRIIGFDNRAPVTPTYNFAYADGTNPAPIDKLFTKQWYILSWQWNGTGNKFGAWINGVQKVNPTVTTPGTVDGAITTYIGSRLGINEFWNGSMGEIILFERLLSTSERQDIEQYLSKKWGIKI